MSQTLAMKQLLSTLFFTVIFTVYCTASITINSLNFAAQANNVLRYDVDFSVSPASRAYVEYYYLDGTDTIWGYTNIADSVANHSFTLVGLVASTSYRFRAAAFDATGVYYGSWTDFTTAALPNGLPSITAIPVPNTSTTEGYLFTNTARAGIFFNNVGETAQIFDRKGNLVWYQIINELAPGGFYQCKYAYPSGEQRIVITGCHDLIEISLAGEELKRITLQGADTNYYFHHEVIKKSNGNFLAIAANPVTFDFTATGGPIDSMVISESILEFDAAGNIVWKWEAKNQLDTTSFVDNSTSPSYWSIPFPGAYNWLHANGLAIDLDGGILLSARRSSELFKINPNNKSIIFNASNNGTFDIFPLSHRFKGQHNVTVTGGNKYMLFDNQGMDTVSRVVEYFALGYDNSFRRQWEYVLPLYSPLLGSAHRLANGNILIGTGLGSSIIELDSDRQTTVLEMQQSEQLYRAYSIASLYEAPPAITFAVADTFCTGPFTPINLSASPASGYFTGPGVTGNVFDPNVAGVGLHSLVYHYGWSTKTVTVNVGCVGIEDVNGLAVQLKLYPNPTTGMVNFSYQLPINHQAQWSIVDLTGKLVTNGSNPTQSGDVNFSVDLSHLAKGMYVAVLEVNGQRIYSRLSLQ